MNSLDTHHSQSHFDLSLIDTLREDFKVKYLVYENGQSCIELQSLQNIDNKARCTKINTVTWEVESIYAPGEWSCIMLKIFQEIYDEGGNVILLNARTNDETLHSQGSLEAWYKRFGFEIVSQDVNGTKMKALIQNRPLSFRIQEYIRRVNTIVAELQN